MRYLLISAEKKLQELTFIIKQDIANINKQIASLQTFVKQRHSHQTSNTPEAKMVNDHAQNVMMMLQNNLATTSMTFKDVLELRTQVCAANIIVLPGYLLSNTRI